MKFYKGVLESQLRDRYVPGTVTTSFKEALMWKERIESNKRKGAARNVLHGVSKVIEIEYDENELLPCHEFQKAGVSEHNRNNCWLNSVKDKAQINTSVKYRILTENEINNLFTF